MLVIDPECGRNVQIRNLNLPGPRSAGPIIGFRVDDATRNDIAAYLFGAAIAENKNRGGKLPLRLGRDFSRWRR